MPAGSINKKEIHDFIADTINTNGYQRRTLWSDAETRQALLVEVFAIEPGNDTGVHYHWDRVEMIVCMRGRGKVTIAELDAGATALAPKWKSPSPDVDIFEGDTLVVPKGALHRFAVPTALANQDPKDADKLPAKLVLIVLHPLLGQPFDETAADLSRATGSPSAPPQKRNYRDDVYCKYDRRAPGGKLNRAIRSRIWGRDAQGAGGEADVAKEQLHLTLYTFVPGQLNPGHFHPNSVEWVACVQGRALMTVRAKKTGKQGWEAQDTAPPPNRDTLVIREGDSVLVPAADWHQYITSGNDDCLLIVSQTPHPILHILENETDF